MDDALSCKAYKIKFKDKRRDNSKIFFCFNEKLLLLLLLGEDHLSACGIWACKGNALRGGISKGS